MPETMEKALSRRAHLLCEKEGLRDVLQQSSQRRAHCRLYPGGDWYSGNANRKESGEILSAALCRSAWMGWIEIDRVSDEELALHLREAWRLIAPVKLQGSLEE